MLGDGRDHRLVSTESGDSNDNEQEVTRLRSVLRKFDVIRHHCIQLGETKSYIIVLKKR
jgi:hypothetical protein